MRAHSTPVFHRFEAARKILGAVRQLRSPGRLVSDACHPGVAVADSPDAAVVSRGTRFHPPPARACYLSLLSCRRRLLAVGLLSVLGKQALLDSAADGSARYAHELKQAFTRQLGEMLDLLGSYQASRSDGGNTNFSDLPLRKPIRRMCPWVPGVALHCPEVGQGISDNYRLRNPPRMSVFGNWSPLRFVVPMDADGFIERWQLSAQCRPLLDRTDHLKTRKYFLLLKDSLGWLFDPPDRGECPDCLAQRK